MNESKAVGGATTPICRCRVLYLGSSVPHITKDGLQGIQQPLRELYPSDGIGGAKGIDSWLSVWSNGLLLENVDEKQKRVTRFFPIEALHYCAAVRYVIVPDAAATTGIKQRAASARFLPLDSPFAKSPSIKHPPLFAAILRRTTGIKVLECHVFICKREAPTNALVRCCFHAYGDSMHARQMGGALYESIYGGTGHGHLPHQPREQEETQAHIDVGDRLDEWQGEASVGTQSSESATSVGGSGGGGDTHTVTAVIEDANHKVWPHSSPNGTPAAGDDDYGSASRSSLIYGTAGSRSARPRQRLMPAAPPPPPLPPPPPQQVTVDGTRKVRRLKTRSERDQSGSPIRHLNGTRRHPPNDLSPTVGFHDHIALYNGHQTVNNHAYSNGHMNGNGFVNGHITGNGHVPANGYGPPNGHATLNTHGYVNGYGSLSRPNIKLISGLHEQATKGSRNRVARALSTRPQPGAPIYPPQVFYGTLPPPSHMQMVPLPPMMPGYGPAMMTLPFSMRAPSRTAEEPVYMPSSGRPLSPTASYQPSHFPHDAYLAQQPYATVDRRRKGKKKNKSNDSSTSNGGGIYKRKNHLNEKAFSYSIQQEHRSRSYGSLANLENGGIGEKVIATHAEQMAQAENSFRQLEISADEVDGSAGEGVAGYDQSPGSASQYSQNSQRSRVRR